jgi:hypothetical protein
VGVLTVAVDGLTAAAVAEVSTAGVLTAAEDGLTVAAGVPTVAADGLTVSNRYRSVHSRRTCCR